MNYTLKLIVNFCVNILRLNIEAICNVNLQYVQVINFILFV